MSENPKPEENLSEEFRAFGKNLVSALHAAWDAPERKRVQEDILGGLNELGATLKREAEQVSNSPTSQRLKDDIEQLGRKYAARIPRSGFDRTC